MLTDGAREQHATTDEQGRFTFPDLLPGRWTLRIDHASLPVEHQLDSDSQQFNLVQGETATPVFVLAPVARTIRFKPGESVNSP